VSKVDHYLVQPPKLRKPKTIESPYFIAEISYDEGFNMATQHITRFRLDLLTEDLRQLMEKRENSELIWAAYIDMNGDETDIKQRLLKELVE